MFGIFDFQGISMRLALDICVSLLRTPKAGNQVTLKPSNLYTKKGKPSNPYINRIFQRIGKKLQSMDGRAYIVSTMGNDIVPKKLFCTKVILYIPERHEVL